MTQARPHQDAQQLPLEIDETRPIRIVDVWHLDKIRGSAMAAYKRLDELGEIALVDICLKTKSEALQVAYDSRLPDEWTHDRLREVERQIREEQTQR